MALDALSRFARLLGLPAHQAEDALHSERAARAVLSRRSFFAASGAMVAGTAFSFAAEPARGLYVMIEMSSDVDLSWSRPRYVATFTSRDRIPVGSVVRLATDGEVVAASFYENLIPIGRVVGYA